MNYPAKSPSPPSEQHGTQTQIGAGTFIVSRQYVGTCTAHDLLLKQIVHTGASSHSIDEGIGTAKNLYPAF